MAFLEYVLESFRSAQQQHRTHNGAEQCSGAAQHGDNGNLDRNIDGENAVRNNELERAAIKCARKRGEKCAHQERIQFAARRVDANSGGRVFVLTDGHEVITKARARSPIVRDKRNYGQSHGCEIERSPERSADEEAGHGQANGSAGDVQVGGVKSQNFRKGDGSKREIRAAKAEGDHTDHSGECGGNQRGEKERNPYGNAETGKKRQPVSAYPKERHVSQRKLSGVSTDQIPGQSQGGKKRNAEEHLKLIIVVDEPGHARPHQYDNEK